MTTVVKACGNKTLYVDSKFQGTKESLVEKLEKSTTLYVGNLSFYTKEEQIYELFTKCGSVRRIIMGLHRDYKTPCGFCFVEYYEREAALDSLKYIDRTKLDNRIIRVDLDYGYCKDRNLGRGKLGGQVRDEHRRHKDEDRTIKRGSIDATTTSTESVKKYVSEDSQRKKRGREDDDEDILDEENKRVHTTIEGN